MKCPKCGFVSYPELPQCKRCGEKFQAAPRKESPGSISPLFSGRVITPREPTQLVDHPPPAPPLPLGDLEGVAASPKEEESKKRVQTFPPPNGRSARESPSQAVPPPVPDAPLTHAASATASARLGLDPAAKPKMVPAPELVRPWRDELSERVESFRRRRAYLRADEEPELNLGFNFEPTETAAGVDARVIQPLEEGAEISDPLDFPLEIPAPYELDVPILDALPLEKSEPEMELSARSERVEPKESAEQPPTDHEEIILGSNSPEDLAAPSPGEYFLPPAPLGKRFVAGLADCLVLLAAAGLFGVVFWRAGGHLTPNALNYGIIGFAAAFVILVYFGLFTALTSSTPGLLWMGIEVRTFNGAHPSSTQAAWRAFGYLVSIAGLMLGFVWALFDSEGMTWHDKMSGTFLTIAPHDRQ